MVTLAITALLLNVVMVHVVMADPKTHLLPIRELVPSMHIMIRLSLPLVAGSSTDPGPQRHIALIES